MNQELSDVHVRFRKGKEKGKETRDQIVNIHWIIEKKKKGSSSRISISASLSMVNPLTIWITEKCKILKEMEMPDHLLCLLRNLHVGEESTVRTRDGTTDWFRNGKGVCQDCILSPSLFNSAFICRVRLELGLVSQSCLTLATSWTTGSSVHGILQGKKYWRGLPFPSWDLPNSGKSESENICKVCRGHHAHLWAG